MRLGGVCACARAGAPGNADDGQLIPNVGFDGGPSGGLDGVELADQIAEAIVDGDARGVQSGAVLGEDITEEDPNLLFLKLRPG